MDVLNKEIVLVLNKNWQAIGVKTPAECFGELMNDTATALHIEGKDVMQPLKWKEWMQQEVKDSDFYVKTVRGKIKIPKVIVLCRYDKVPRKRPKFSSKAIWMREQGKCAYTGKKLTPNTGNIDHLIPKSRGGITDWSNCVLAHKDINSYKRDRTPEEAGLTLLINPKSPKEMPISYYLQNKYNIKEWDIFLNLQ